MHCFIPVIELLRKSQHLILDKKSHNLHPQDHNRKNEAQTDP